MDRKVTASGFAIRVRVRVKVTPCLQKRPLNFSDPGLVVTLTRWPSPVGSVCLPRMLCHVTWCQFVHVWVLGIIFRTMTFRPYISGPEVRTVIFFQSTKSSWLKLLHIQKSVRYLAYFFLYDFLKSSVYSRYILYTGDLNPLKPNYLEGPKRCKQGISYHGMLLGSRWLFTTIN